MNRYYIFPKGDEQNILEFNVTTSIKRTLKSKVTMSPVEKGSNVADHVRNMPVEVTFAGFLVQEDQINKEAGYEEYLAILNSWRSNRYILTVHYDDLLSRDPNMYITQFSMERDAKTSDAWKVSMTLQQVEEASQASFVDNFPIEKSDQKPKLQEFKIKNTQTQEVDIVLTSSIFQSTRGL